MGEQNLKNIARSVRAYQVLPISEQSKRPENLLERAALPVPDKASIAVLPFQNMSGDPEQEYFADGMVEDIITELSRNRTLFVIARNSTFTYKGKAVDLTQVGRELGVAYLVEGSVRKVTNRVRVTVQLIEAAAGAHIWADKFDGNLENIFDLQDEIVRRVVSTLHTRLLLDDNLEAHQRSRPKLSTWQLFKRAWREHYKLTRVSLEKTVETARAAIENDPESPLGHQALASALAHTVYMGFAKDPDTMRTEALAACSRALDLDSNFEMTHWTHGVILGYLYGRYDDACASLRQAIDLNQNYSLAHGTLGTILVYTGKPKEGIKASEFAIRLNPLDPSIFFRYTGLATAYHAMRDFEKCVEWAQRSSARKPDWWFAHALLASAFAHLGRLEEAHLAISNLRAVFPEGTMSTLRKLHYAGIEHDQLLRQGLQRAGLPD
jgi:adenylate cyclase